MMITALLAGAFIGSLLALTGAGGGVIAVPLLIFVFGLSFQYAAPIGLVATFIGASIATLISLKQGILRYRAALWIAAFGMLTSPLGIKLAAILPHKIIAVLFIVILMFIAIKTLLTQRLPPKEPLLLQPTPQDIVPTPRCAIGDDGRIHWNKPCAYALALTGAVTGLISGLLGVGGGFIIVPALLKFSNLPLKSIQATTLAILSLVTFSGMVSALAHHTVLLDIAIPFSIGTLIAVIAFRPIAVKLPQRTLHLLFAIICLMAAAILSFKTFVGY